MGELSESQPIFLLLEPVCGKHGKRTENVPVWHTACVGARCFTWQRMGEEVECSLSFWLSPQAHWANATPSTSLRLFVPASVLLERNTADRHSHVGEFAFASEGLCHKNMGPAVALGGKGSLTIGNLCCLTSMHNTTYQCLAVRAFACWWSNGLPPQNMVLRWRLLALARHCLLLLTAPNLPLHPFGRPLAASSCENTGPELLCGSALPL